MSSLVAPGTAKRIPVRSRRLLARARDDRLVELVRRGEEAAFEAVFERYGGPVLSFCRQMLRSHEDAEDATQQAFASAYRDLQRSERPVALKPWLFTVARNRCLSILRARRPDPLELDEDLLPTADERVERRAELRELLEDMASLPEDQRAALVLFELDDLSQEEIAQVLGCETRQVKGMVFRARAGLMERREGRQAPCEEIREELATARRGSLRRSRLRHHLRGCPPCAAFREEVRRQRSLMALVLPVAPSAGLKAALFGGLGIGPGTGGGLTAASGVGGIPGLLAGIGSAGSATVAKVALGAAIVGGAGVADSALDQRSEGEARSPSAAPTRPAPQKRPARALGRPQGGPPAPALRAPKRSGPSAARRSRSTAPRRASGGSKAAPPPGARAASVSPAARGRKGRGAAALGPGGSAGKARPPTAGGNGAAKRVGHPGAKPPPAGPRRAKPRRVKPTRPRPAPVRRPPVRARGVAPQP